MLCVFSAGGDGLLSLSGDCQTGHRAGEGETEKAARVQPPDDLTGRPTATPQPLFPPPEADQRCSAVTAGVLVGWLRLGRISTHLNYQHTGSTPIWTLKT